MKSPLRVLIVEDSDDATLLVIEQLRRGGCEAVWQRVETEEATRAALAEKEWDAIVADYALPHFSALAALNVLQASGLDLPFIIISSSIDEEIAVAAMKAGAHDYVNKSNLTRLVPAIQREMREAAGRAARRKAEAALRESEANLVLAQRIGQVGSWEEDLLTGGLRWSAETFRIFGYLPDEFVPTREKFFSLLHPADCDLVKRTADTALRERKTYDLEHRVLRPDGSERIIHERAEVLCNGEGQPVRMVGTAQDITERKQLEAQLRHSQKMEAVGRLAGGVAHDFNNILTVIKGYTEVILASQHLNPAVANQLKQVAAAAERATNLTRQLLAFGRKQLLQTKILDLNQVITQVAQMLQRLLGEDISLRLKFRPALPLIAADISMLEQMLLTLAVHARDAMPKGGQLIIETTLAEINAAYVLRHPEAQTGNFVCVSISDTGAGMDNETMACIFEPFYSTKELGRGTGLGLATVYGIVKQHQGWVDVFSEIAKGTTFKVFLPPSVAQAQTTTPEVKQLPVSGGAETILLVEDEPPLRALAISILQKYGYQILDAASGPDAQCVWEKHAEKIDLLLTDMVMPGGMTGRDLALKLLGQKPQLKVLYTTGYSVDIVQSDFTLKPGLNFIAKPYTPTSLAQAVRQCLDRSAQM